MKYHAASCYRNFQRDIAKTDSISQPSEQTELSQQCPVECTIRPEPYSKRLKPSIAVCIICSSDRTTVKQKTVHTLYRISENPMAQKPLNVAMLFKDYVYNETAAMHDVGDVFATDILYHTHCCKSYFNKYLAKIEEIMNNIEKEDSLTTLHCSWSTKMVTCGRVPSLSLGQSC